MTHDEIEALRRVVSVKPLVWVYERGEAMLGPYRMFKAKSPLGWYVYGTDSEGKSYYTTALSGIIAAEDEEKAKQLAEDAWEKAALSEIGKYASRALPAAADVGDEKPAAWMYHRRHGFGLSFPKPECFDDDGEPCEPSPLYDPDQVARLCEQAKREAYAECKAIAHEEADECGPLSSGSTMAARRIARAIEALAEKKS